MARSSTQKKKREIVESAKHGKFSVRDIETVVKGVHVAPRGARTWTVRKTGDKPVRRSFRSRDAALGCAKQVAREDKVEVIVHRKDGRVQKLKATS